MAGVLAVTMPTLAQETYENAKIIQEDLNGTARYVGMGGALDALGADISTISTNPAGIGLFRSSRADVSFGMVSQQDAADYSRGNKTNMSFDQAGFVIAKKSGADSYLNVAFNYHKSRNFDYILSAADGLRNASQNKLSWAKLYNGLLYPNAGNEDNYVPDLDHSYISCNQLDDIYTRNLFYAANDGNAYFYEADAYDFDRAHKGYVGEYDFNISGNIHDQWYLGLTVGLHDVHYRHQSDYTESIVNNPENIRTLNVYDERKISGEGVDLKFGVIFRPIEYSNFRIGLTVATPTWYDLTTKNYTEVSDGNYTAYANDRYDFKVFTPWKFGLSLGHVLGDCVAVGAGFEYADYTATKTRINTGSYYSYWSDSYVDESENDQVMNSHTDATLKAVSSFKVGAEWKATPELSLRAGYNYIMPLYDKNGYKDGTLDSNGSYLASATDFTNWDATNRFTLGMGYAFGNFNLDLAYQYTWSNGDFYPFTNYQDKDYAEFDNIANSVKVNNKRHQLLLTMGYRF